MINQLSNIKIVLCTPFHPGNIGSTARAMKNMGLSSLYLVNPKEFPSQVADSMAAGAKDILSTAIVVNSLEEALKDTTLVIAASARDRTINRPMLNLPYASDKLLFQAQTDKVAIIFGTEKNGLSNDELKYAHFQVTINANPEYPVLNLAQSVQIICYEIFQRFTNSLQDPLKTEEIKFNSNKLATVEQTEGMLEHFEQVLKQTKVLNPDMPKRLMPKLRRLFLRSALEEDEVNILRGFLKAIGYNYQK